MAEKKGFEPSIPFPVYSLSRGAPSTTRPPLRCPRSKDFQRFGNSLSYGLSQLFAKRCKKLRGDTGEIGGWHLLCRPIKRSMLPAECAGWLWPCQNRLQSASPLGTQPHLALPRIFERMAAGGPAPQARSIDSRKSWRIARYKAQNETQTQTTGPSCSGRTSKIHWLTNGRGGPGAFSPTAGNTVDIKVAVFAGCRWICVSPHPGNSPG